MNDREKKTSIEHVFTNFRGELLFGIIITLIFLIGSGILSTRLRRLKENPDYRPFKLIKSEYALDLEKNV